MKKKAAMIDLDAKERDLDSRLLASLTPGEWHVLDMVLRGRRAVMECEVDELTRDARSLMVAAIQAAQEI